MAENPTAGLTQEEEEEDIEYDSDGNPIASTTKKIIMPLPPIDHSEVQFSNHLSTDSVVTTTDQYLKCSVFVLFIVNSFCFKLQIDYPPFEKNFYNEHEELSSLTGTQVMELRHKLNLRVSLGFVLLLYFGYISIFSTSRSVVAVKSFEGLPHVQFYFHQ